MRMYLSKGEGNLGPVPRFRIAITWTSKKHLTVSTDRGVRGDFYARCYEKISESTDC
jgi:hypothetical protein